MKNLLSIVLSGEAGQGLQTIEDFLVKTISNKYYVFSTHEVMSRVRGGNNSVEIRVSNNPVYGYQEAIDVLFLLNDHSLYRLRERIHENTLVFGDQEILAEEDIQFLAERFTHLPIEELASQAGSVLYSNTLLFGLIAGMLDLNTQFALGQIAGRFASKKESMITGNQDAFNAGYKLGISYQSIHSLTGQKTEDLRIITGTEAIGIGALGGGCNFIASYPMSPATGVLIYLSQKSNDFGVFVEQAEDEIAAMNMTIGAWYAGARALATTSGGGFALMEEAISLSGITETPCVTHIAQRPGPGTGLPTRTAQEDLNLAVYAGHGEFARAIYAPGTMEDAIKLSQKAFYMADKYQVPTFILTDQYILDSKYQMAPFQLKGSYLESFVTKSDEDYKRYAMTDKGISPRAIPNHGQGLVKCDSDEHTEYGLITEDFDVRILQNDKRLKRRSLLLEDYEAPELIGPSDYETLLVGWGSTYGTLKEYVDYHSDGKTAYLYIKQPFPLAPSLKSYFDQAKVIIDVENNATGQFANILKLELDVTVTHKLLKYNGVPFAIEDILTFMKEVK